MTPLKGGKQTIALLLMKAFSREKKRKQPCTNRVGSHAEMMRQYYRARISFAEMGKPMASVTSTILCKTKGNDHVPGVVAEIEVETSHSSEVQEIEKLASNSLVLQSPTQHEQSIVMKSVRCQTIFLTKSQKRLQ